MRTLLALGVVLVGAPACFTNHALDDVDGGPYESLVADAATAGATGAAGAGAAGEGGTKADPATLGPSQSWTGYEEARKFSSGSDAIALTFAIDAAGVVKGTVVFGMGTPPAPATDPNASYPPDLVQGGVVQNPIPTALGYVAEGYSYAFDGGSFDGHRLRIDVNTAQLWTSWCALQTQAADGSSSCLPPWPAMGTSSTPKGAFDTCEIQNPQDQKWYSVTCVKLGLCSAGVSPCACTPAGCTTVAEGFGSSFDLFVEGTSASGVWNRDNVHFVKN
jgi:hypothetical protein